MTVFSPKLVVRGADQAIAFYHEVFDAAPGERFADGDTVQHAALTLYGAQVSVKDADDTDRAPDDEGGAGVVLEITTDDPDALAERAIAAGAAVVFPVADQEYGARAGRIRDPFGHQWILSTPLG